MKIEYNPSADAAYIRLGEGDMKRTSEIDDDVLVDFDAAGHVLGVEVLWLQRRGLRAGRGTRRDAPGGARGLGSDE